MKINKVDFEFAILHLQKAVMLASRITISVLKSDQIYIHTCLHTCMGTHTLMDTHSDMGSSILCNIL